MLMELVIFIAIIPPIEPFQANPETFTGAVPNSITLTSPLANTFITTANSNLQVISFQVLGNKIRNGTSKCNSANIAYFI